MIALSLVGGVYLFEAEATRSKTLPHLVLFLLILSLLFFGFTVRLGVGRAGETEFESWIYFGFLGPLGSPGSRVLHSVYYAPFYVAVFLLCVGIAVTTWYLVRPLEAKRALSWRKEKPAEGRD